MLKKILYFVIIILLVFLTFCGIEYSRWKKQIGFINSDTVKAELIQLKINATLGEHFWYNKIMSSNTMPNSFSQSERIDYFVGILYFLREDMHGNGASWLTFYSGISKEDIKLMYKRLIEIEKTKYYKSLDDDFKNYLKRERITLKHCMKEGYQCF